MSNDYLSIISRYIDSCAYYSITTTTFLSIIAMNDHSLQLIERARARDLSSWSFLKYLSLWDSIRTSENKHTDTVIAQVFDRTMNALSVNMERLILEAEHIFQDLNDLGEQLTTLQAIIVHQDSAIALAKSNLIDNLWSRLGGNRRLLRTFDYHLVLLKGLGSYKDLSLVHVISALQTLHALSEDMEDIRECVASPDLIGAAVPVEVHINSIQASLGRLRDGRIRARGVEEDMVGRLVGDGSGTALSGCISEDLHFEGRQCTISL